MNETSSNEQTTTKRFGKLYKAVILLFFALVILILYTFLHEFGHALPGLIFGGSIRTFIIF